MAELTYDQFNSSNDLTEMASQINAAIEKLSKRIDGLDGGTGTLLDPMSQGVAINLADSFGRTLEAYLNNPNKKMLGDWILEGTLVVDGTITINGLASVWGDFHMYGDSFVQGTLSISGDMSLSSGSFNVNRGEGENLELAPGTDAGLWEWSTQQAGETFGGFSGYSIVGTDYVWRTSMPVNPFGSGAFPSIYITETFNGGGADSEVKLTADFITLSGQSRFSSGTAALPGLSFTGDTNTGMYRDAADSLSFATGGVQRLDIDSGGIKGKLAFQGPAGTAAAPSFSIDGDTNTGMYRVGTDNLGFSTAGVARLTMNATAMYPQQAIRHSTSGTSALPSYSWNTDIDTGFYLYSTGHIGWSGYGNNGGYLNDNGIRVPSGSVGTPSFSFTTDTNTGIYRYSSDSIALVTGGVRRLRMDGTLVLMPKTYSDTTGSAANLNTSSSGRIRRYSSSLRYKDDIRGLADAEADLIYELSPVRYRSKREGFPGGSPHSYDGLISEDVTLVNPRWADFSPTPDCSCEVADPEDYEIWEHEPDCLRPEGVQYPALIPAVINVITRQRDTIEALDERLNILEKKV